MKKSDLSLIRKQLKLDNESKLTMGEIVFNYCKSDSKSIIYSEKKHFYSLDDDVKELLFKNFKKILTGDIDKKIYDVPLDLQSKNLVVDSFVNMKQSTALINSEIGVIMEHILNTFHCDTDYVTIFVNFSVVTAVKKKNEDSEDTSTLQKADLILCTINPISVPKKELKIDIKDKLIKTNSALETVVKSSPLEGFAFPSITDGCMDINKIIYYTGNKEPNEMFLEKLLGAKIKMTAEKEKDIFNEALKSIVGDEISTKDMYDIYNGMNPDVVEVDYGPEESKNEERIVSAKEVEKILIDKGYKNADNFCNVVKRLTDEENFDFKVANVIPEKNSGIKIADDNIAVSLSSKDLHRCKQVTQDGKKCLLIELSGDIEIEGFTIKND